MSQPLPPQYALLRNLYRPLMLAYTALLTYHALNLGIVFDQTCKGVTPPIIIRPPNPCRKLKMSNESEIGGSDHYQVRSQYIEAVGFHQIADRDPEGIVGVQDSPCFVVDSRAGSKYSCVAPILP